MTSVTYQDDGGTGTNAQWFFDQPPADGGNASGYIIADVEGGDILSVGVNFVEVHYDAAFSELAEFVYTAAIAATTFTNGATPVDGTGTAHHS